MIYTIEPTSDIFRRLENSAYKEPSKALREFIDNCLIGMKQLYNTKRQIEINFFVNDGDVIPNKITIIDNGIGMDKETLLTSFYNVYETDGKTLNGGTSTHGLGAKQASQYLGEWGNVITFPCDGKEGTISQMMLPKNEKAKVDINPISLDEFKKINPIFLNGHGTSIEIINIKSEKWDKNWWTTISSTKYLRLLSRVYRLLLIDDKISITVNLHKNGKIVTKQIESAIIPFDNGLIDNTSTDDYLNSTRNQFTAKGIRRKLETIDTTIVINIGKTLAPHEKDCWDTFGKDNLFESKPSDFANPGGAIYQNNIEISSHKLKKSDREIGLMHLNGLFFEAHLPNDIKLPTTTIKDDLQETLKNEIVEIILEEAEKLYPPNDNHDEFAWHKKFKDVIMSDGILGQAIRNSYFGGITHIEAKTQIKHEYQLGSDRPDFLWSVTQDLPNGEQVDIVKAIFELKPLESQSEDSAQLAKYWMSYPHTERIILLAQSHSTQIQNTIPQWNLNRKANFELLTYDKLDISLK
jgi:hypothetical protein